MKRLLALTSLLILTLFHAHTIRAQFAITAPEQGGTGSSSTPSNAQLLIGTSDGVYVVTTVPNCTGTNKLLFNSATRTFSCDTDQAGSGAGGGFNATGTPSQLLIFMTPSTGTSSDKLSFNTSTGALTSGYYVGTTADTSTFGGNIKIGTIFIKDVGGDIYFGENGTNVFINEAQFNFRDPASGDTWVSFGAIDDGIFHMYNSAGNGLDHDFSAATTQRTITWRDLAGTVALHNDNISSFLNNVGYVSSTNPATGTILYYSGSKWNNLATSTDGKVLEMLSGVPVWATDDTGSGGGATTTISAQGVTVNGPAFTFATSGPLLAITGSGTTLTFTTLATSTILQGYSTSVGGNPTASVGLTTVNGSATTYMRSDGAPALDVTIAPLWTGLHQFSVAGASTTQLWSGSSTLPTINGDTQIIGIASTSQLRSPSGTIASLNTTNHTSTNSRTTGSKIIPQNTTLNASGQVGINTTTSSFKFHDGTAERALPAIKSVSFGLENVTSSEDFALNIFTATSTITEVRAVNKTSGDTATFNFYFGASRTSSTAQGAKSLFASNQTLTATTSSIKYTSFASTTVNTDDAFRFITSSASSSQLTVTIKFYVNP